MRFITKVTVTGADDATNPDELIALADEFPFAEFGLLLSPKSGRPRYPSIEWLEVLARKTLSHHIHCSGHICGAWATEFLEGDWPQLPCDRMVETLIWNLFRRFQINTFGVRRRYDVDRLLTRLGNFDVGHGFLIFQYDETGQAIVKDLLDVNGKNFEVLFDCSGGNGILPDSWPPVLPGIECGYAGGLTPNNIVEQIEKMERATWGQKVWIDAETGLRTENRFDLAKVRAFLQAAEPWVVK